MISAPTKKDDDASGKFENWLLRLAFCSHDELHRHSTPSMLTTDIVMVVSHSCEQIQIHGADFICLAHTLAMIYAHSFSHAAASSFHRTIFPSTSSVVEPFLFLSFSIHKLCACLLKHRFELRVKSHKLCMHFAR